MVEGEEEKKLLLTDGGDEEVDASTSNAKEDEDDEMLFGEGSSGDNYLLNQGSNTSQSSSSLWRLYLSHGFTAWTLRMWEFAVALLLIAMKPNSVLLPAVYTLVLSLSVMLFNPLFGHYVDTKSRLMVTRWSLTFIKIPFALSSFFVYLVLSGKITEEAQPGWYWLSIVGVIGLTSCGHVAYSCNKLAVEKDWVSTIFSKDTLSLSKTNSVLRRIDLTCKLVAPMAAGFVMTYRGQSAGAFGICLWNVCSFIPELYFLSKFYNAFPVLHKSKPKDEQASSSDKKHLVLKTFYTMASGWKRYKKSTIFKPGVALALLYATVLSMGPIMSAYCFYRGMSEALLGSLRAVGAVFGISSTFLFPHLRERLGIVKTGLVSIWGMIATISMCLVAVEYSHPEDGNCSDLQGDEYTACKKRYSFEMGFLIAGVVVARFGLWLFDLTVTQLLQEWVEKSTIGAISGVQGSLQMLFSMIPPILGIIFSGPSDFNILAIVSVAFVCAAGLMFTSFYAFVRDSGRDEKDFSAHKEDGDEEANVEDFSEDDMVNQP